MPDAQPYRNFNFVVEIDGVERFRYEVDEAELRSFVATTG
jgi:hypothetical protein